MGIVPTRSLYLWQSLGDMLIAWELSPVTHYIVSVGATLKHRWEGLNCILKISLEMTLETELTVLLSLATSDKRSGRRGWRNHTADRRNQRAAGHHPRTDQNVSQCM